MHSNKTLPLIMVNYLKADDGSEADTVRPCEKESVMLASASMNVSTPRVGLPMVTLACGLLSFFLGLLVAIPGIFVGHLARAQIKDNPYRFGGARLALTGLTMCYLASALSIVTIIYLAAYPETLQVVGEYTGYSLLLSGR